MEHPPSPNATVGAILTQLALRFARSLVTPLFWLLALFLIGTGVGAGVCMHFGCSLIYASFGGLIAVALAVAFALALQIS